MFNISPWWWFSERLCRFEKGSEDMARAEWNGEILAESEHVKRFDGVVYFPPESVKMEYLRLNSHCSDCPWKGRSWFFDVIVHGEINNDAALIFMEPTRAAWDLKDKIAFRRGVTVTEELR
jgi:uncharacterized protein (DUF427 family)